MKRLQKLTSALLALVLALGLGCTAFAADTGYTITVNGAQTGVTYKAYKVFDATYSGNSVSYTIPTNSNIANENGFSGVFATTENGGKTYVTVESGVTDEQVIAWLENHSSAYGNSVAEATCSDTATTVTLNVSSAGYYYVTSTTAKGEDGSTKSAVEVTTAKPDATINDKLDTEPSLPDNAKKVNGKTVNDMQVGETATFTVTFDATNYAVKNGTATPITSYTVTDTPDGFTINKDSVEVTVNNTEYAISEKTVSSSVNEETGVLTVTIPWDQTTYPSPSTVVVSYTAALTNKHLAGKSSNKATVKYNETKLPDIPETKTYNYTIQVEKVDDANEDTKLADAQFVLKNSSKKYYKVDSETGVVSWVENQADATVVSTNEEGLASFQGLAHGSYTLVETKAPDGYNLAEDSTITLSEITTEETGTATLTHQATVRDKAGSTLPSTGGMGTTVLYVAGGLMVVGAAVLMITRRRMEQQ